MLMGAAALSIKTVIKNVDDYLLKPLGNTMFHWNMQFNDDKPEIKGDLEIKWAGDLIMQNPYGLILVNPDVFPHIKSTQAKIFANWLISSKGQKAIGDFKVDGKQLFCPNAEKKKKNSLLACPAN